MSRLLFLIAIVIVVYLIIRSFRKNSPRQDKPVVDDMVRCRTAECICPRGKAFWLGGNSLLYRTSRCLSEIGIV